MVDVVQLPDADRSAGSLDTGTDQSIGLGDAVCIILDGHVQGVGFRPFVYRLAGELGITGYVRNCLGEVEILACGRPGSINQFRRDLVRQAPPLSRPRIIELTPVKTRRRDHFDIIASDSNADARIFVPSDHFMCDDCRQELHDPCDRRYRYPFINCTQCGPRYTLIESLPYDRPNTSMVGFPLCAACESEYLDPANRRFHAEPVSCPDCGPQLLFEAHEALESKYAGAALAAALQCLADGQIVAVKGIGGYHLLCDARSDEAIALLRQRKQRPDKPLAVMFPVSGVDGLDTVRRHASLRTAEESALMSPQRPIVLVAKRQSSDLADGIAPGLRELGAFLPYSPLHELLLADFGRPLVATSGNISGEPVLTDNAEASKRLTPIADAFLHHDRPIVRPADDSVCRRVGDVIRPIRIGRGSAPVEIETIYRQPQPLLAVGGHMKGTVALAWENRVVVSPHIGEMDSPRSLDVFERVAEALQSLYGVRAERIVCDAHMGYTTHRWAQAQALPVDTIWHHHAHASALAGEQAMPGSWLMFAWDGVGLGEDDTLWGGEALLGVPGSWRRVCSMRPFRPPGGDRAGREPWRSAAALHWECGAVWPDCPDIRVARAAWERQMNCPQTSAAGRLFDAAAAIITGQTHASFEAQGPMQIESLCRSRREPVSLSLREDENCVWRTDWEPLLAALSDTAVGHRERAEIFHSSMAHVVLQQACKIREQHAISQVGLCGGVFMNRVLSEEVVDLLESHDFRVALPKVLPCNDAAISFGQAVELAAQQTGGRA